MQKRDPSLWMWAEACQMLDRAERLHRQFARPSQLAPRGPTWEAPVDIFETENQLGIIVALPGVEPRGIEVSVDGDMLIVTGSRPLPTFTDPSRILRMEIPHGQFERRIRLESGSLELIRREARDGCLLLIFGKRR